MLAGRKTQTRRMLKPQPELNAAGLWQYPPAKATECAPEKWVKRFGGFCQTDDEGLKSFLTPIEKRNFLPYALGDRLWVREAHAFDGPIVRYYATDDVHELRRKRPSIHMPRWASRLTLTLTDVRVQRLQDISHNDALAEGVEMESADPPFYYVPGIWPHSLTAVGIEEPGGRHAERSYAKLWNRLHGDDAWEANPWVVALTFTVANGNIDQLGAAA